jgi:hypothetical protein
LTKGPKRGRGSPYQRKIIKIRFPPKKEKTRTGKKEPKEKEKEKEKEKGKRKGRWCF